MVLEKYRRMSPYELLNLWQNELWTDFQNGLIGMKEMDNFIRLRTKYFG